MRAIIFANGQVADPHHLRDVIQPGDYIIAVNGGTHYALEIEIIPHTIIGDLDSLSAAEKEQVEAAGVPLEQFPSQKNETDLELALFHVIKKGATEIILLAALGGRADHSLANVFLLTRPELESCDVRLVDGNQTVFLIRSEAQLVGTPGDIVSILPIGGDAVGVSNEGLAWPLHNEALPLGSPRGMSNVLLGDNAVIRLRKGMLLCILTHSQG